MSTTINGSATSGQGLARAPSRSSGLIDRVRSSFSASRRPSISQSPSVDSYSSISHAGRFDSNSKGSIVNMASPSLASSHGNGVVGGGGSLSSPENRLRKRRSIFRKASARSDAQSPPVPLVPPQLALPTAVAELAEDEEKEAQAQQVDDANQKASKRPSTASSQTLPAARKHVLSTSASPRRQFEAHQKARLSLRQACSLLEQCASEIKMRGLAMVGIFRPFRYAETNEEVERLAELFLLASKPQIYQGVFALETTTSTSLASLNASSMMRDTLNGKANPEQEFKRKLSYAHVFDVVALFKWGLRRLDVVLSDLKSTQQYTWYENFVKQEKLQNYPAKAFSTILLASLSTEMSKLLKIVFDLMSTVSAHHLTNAMPAQRISHVLGYWLFGRVGVDHEPISFPATYAAWDKSGQVTEHLLLAYIREQSSQFHLMPSRLTELVQDYPYIAPNAAAPSLSPGFVPQEQTALLVETRTENLIITPKQPRRTPKEILLAAIKSQNADIEASEDLDDWMVMTSNATKQQHQQDGQDQLEILNEDGNEDEPMHDRRAGSEADVQDEAAMLFAEEDVRALHIVEKELTRHRDIFDGKLATKSASNGTSNGFSSHDSAHSQLSDLTPSSSGTLVDMTLSPSRSSTLPRSNGKSLTTLSEMSEEGGGAFDWGAFSSSGFASSTPQVDRLDFDKAFRPKNELERVFEEQDRVEAIAMEKKMRRKNGLPLFPERRGPPRHILSSVSTFNFDDSFAACWQDQLLDESTTARLPYLICAQLNHRMSSALLGNAAMSSSKSPDQWLIIHETVVAPRPPMPPTPASSSTFFRRNTVSRKNVAGSLRAGRRSGEGRDGENVNEFGSTRFGSRYNDDDDRQSLFSIRSGFSTHFSRPANGIRKMRSMLLTRKASSAGLGEGQTQADIDAEVEELQAAVSHANRERQKQQDDVDKAAKQQQQKQQLKESTNTFKPTVFSPSTTDVNTVVNGSATDYAKAE